MSDCGFCHHPATVHYTRCAVDAGKSTQCRCSQPDFAHERQGATIAALVEALEFALKQPPFVPDRPVILDAKPASYIIFLEQQLIHIQEKAHAALKAAKEGAR